MGSKTSMGRISLLASKAGLSYSAMNSAVR